MVTDTGNDVSRIPDIFSRLTDSQLRQSKEAEHGIFIAESPKVIRVALDAGYEPVAMLCERRHVEGDASDIIARCPDMPVYTAGREALAGMTGYTLTRGVLCAMRRPEMPSPEHICAGARRVCVMQGITDTTNVGAIFRCAAALGIDAVLCSRDNCDPLNRRSVRVSMGSVFLVPWTWIDNADSMKDLGFKTVAMALTDKSISIADPGLRQELKLAIVMGTEGEGLPTHLIENADYTVRIPMHHKVDSLNVAAASAIAFWEFTKK